MEENKVVKNTEVVNENNAAPKAEENNAAASKEGKKFNRNGKNRKNFQRGPRKEVVKGGKRMKFSALVVVGNGKGKFGFATGKSGEVPDAIKKAVDRAKKNLIDVKMVKGGTIPHDIIGRFGATRVFLKPAPEGTGIIAGGPVRAILELSGVKNVYSKVYGSRNKINIIRATANALENEKDYKSVVALRKGGNENVK